MIGTIPAQILTLNFKYMEDTMKLLFFLTATLCVMFAFSPISLVQAETIKVVDSETRIEKGMSKLTDGIGDIVGGLTSSNVKAKKDLTTLSIGGIIGLVAGSLVANFIDVKLIGISMMPVVGTLVGVYFANEGHLDRYRNQ